MRLERSGHPSLILPGACLPHPTLSFRALQWLSYQHSHRDFLLLSFLWFVPCLGFNTGCHQSIWGHLEFVFKGKLSAVVRGNFPYVWDFGICLLTCCEVCVCVWGLFEPFLGFSRIQILSKPKREDKQKLVPVQIMSDLQNYLHLFGSCDYNWQGLSELLS